MNNIDPNRGEFGQAEMEADDLDVGGVSVASEEDEITAREYDFYLAKSYLAAIVPLWLIAIGLRMAVAPFTQDTWNEMISAIQVPSLYILLAMGIGWSVRSFHSAMQLAAGFMKIHVFMVAARLVLAALGVPDSVLFYELAIAVSSAMYGAQHLWLSKNYFDNKRLIPPAFVLLVASCAAMAFIDDIRFSAMAKAYSYTREEDPEFTALEAMPVDRLWQLQPEIVESAAKFLPVESDAEGRVYVLVIAPDGTQEIFEREARQVLDALGSRFADSARMQVVLSNRGQEPAEIPLATNGNLDQISDIVRQDARPDEDILVVYVTSHGSEDAEASTILPTYASLEPVAASRLRGILDSTGIRQRIVMVSACYSGSWIEPLATDDTIIMTAARKDRTSYGCNDRRETTFFGQHLLASGLAGKQPLGEVFEKASEAIAAQESEIDLVPSEPQVHVGENMQSVWAGSSD